MKAVLSKSFAFEAAHLLPNVPAGHKCRNMHGHSYRVTLQVAGEVDPRLGWVMDYGQIQAAFEPVRRQLDHNTLNEIAGLENPTSEHIARWVWERLKGELPGLSAVIIQETADNCCEYRGE